MKKNLKIIGILLLIISIIIAWFYYQMITSKERQNNDVSECESTEFITEKPSFCLEKKSTEKIHEISIRLLRNNKIVEDTIIVNNIENKNKHFVFNIPFNKFLKTDFILIKTKNLTYKISGFGYYSDGGHWGMFGYLGDSDCHFDYDKIKVNGKKYIGM
jgi:hypothetical protein